MVGLRASSGVEEAIPPETGSLERLIKTLGPALIGASDDDPSGIGTYATADASRRYSTLWTALVSYPLLAAVQFTCAKIGMVSGVGLAEVLCQRYPRPLVFVAVFALLAANSINAGADIGAIAAVINLLPPIPLTLLIVPLARVHCRDLYRNGLADGGQVRLPNGTVVLSTHGVSAGLRRPFPAIR